MWLILQIKISDYFFLWPTKSWLVAIAANTFRESLFIKLMLWIWMQNLPERLLLEHYNFIF